MNWARFDAARRFPRLLDDHAHATGHKTTRRDEGSSSSSRSAQAQGTEDGCDREMSLLREGATTTGGRGWIEYDDSGATSSCRCQSGEPLDVDCRRATRANRVEESPGSPRSLGIGRWRSDKKPSG